MHRPLFPSPISTCCWRTLTVGFGFRLRVFSKIKMRCAQGIMDDKKKLGALACFALALILGIASAASPT